MPVPDQMEVLQRFMELSAALQDLQARLQQNPSDVGLRARVGEVSNALARLVAENPWVMERVGSQQGGAQQGTVQGSGPGLGVLEYATMLALEEQSPSYRLSQQQFGLEQERFRWQQEQDRLALARQRWLDEEEQRFREAQAAWDRYVQGQELRGRFGLAPELVRYVVPPGTQYIPGWEPGGIMEQVIRGYGYNYSAEPWRTMQGPALEAPPEWPQPKIPTWAPETGK